MQSIDTIESSNEFHFNTIGVNIEFTRFNIVHKDTSKIL